MIRSTPLSASRSLRSAGGWLQLCALCALCGWIGSPLAAANLSDEVSSCLNARRPFPAWDSAQAVDGALLEVDVIHRRGTFRADGSGSLHAFTMPANGVVSRLGVGADLRDVPLATHGRWYLLPDQDGAPTRLGAFQDDATVMLREGVRWRVEAVDAPAGTIAVMPVKDGQPMPGAVRIALEADAWTRFRNGAGEAKAGDLTVGDLLVVDLAGDGAARRLGEAWIGADATTRAAADLRRTHLDFLTVRGLPAWIDAIAGERMTVTLFAAGPDDLAQTLKLADIHPEQWAKEGHHLHAVVANQELRSYNPPVDKQAGHLVEYHALEQPGIGSGGQQWVLKMPQLLEGFRPGEVVRLFPHGGWKIEDMPFGEGIYDHIWESPEIDPGAFPYRTDFCNGHLPWYRLQPGRLPPGHSAHERWGDLLEIAADGRGGKLRDESSGRSEAFTLPPFATVWSQGAEGALGDLAIGTRCRFAMHQDAAGAWSVASVVSDEFTAQKQRRLSARVVSLRPERGEVHVAWQLPREKNYDDDWVSPPDTGSAILSVDAATALWKGDQAIALGALAVGDLLLANRTGAGPTALGRCTALWVGEDTIKAAAERQRARHQEAIRRAGVPALVEKIEGRLVTMVCIGADRDAFRDLLGGDPWGKPVHIQVVDERLQPRGQPLQVGFNNNLKEGATVGCYGAAGRRWVIDCQALPEGLAAGGWLRVFNHGWALPPAAAPH